MKITVKVPTSEPYYDYGMRKVRSLNTAESVKVHVLTGLDEVDSHCKRLTGLTPAQYQERNGVAWNE